MAPPLVLVVLLLAGAASGPPGPGGPQRPSATPAPPAPAAPTPEGLRFLALGDSYTIGEGVEPEGRWPSQLAAALAQRRVRLAPPRIIAQTGWTTEELATAMDTAAPPGPFELVSLQVGVNDQYRGLPLEGYRERFAALLDRAVSLAGGKPGRVLVLSIPDWGVTPFARDRGRSGVGEEVDRFNAAAREAARARGARWVDVTPSSRRAGEEPGLLAPDGLHPSAELYAEWVRLLVPVALRALAPAEGTPRR